MTYEEWLKGALDRIDDAVSEDIDDNQGSPDYEEEDMLMAAANAIWDEVSDAKEGSALQDMLTESLARAWIRLAYSQWYTGDVKEEDNLKHLLEIVQGW